MPARLEDVVRGRGKAKRGIPSLPSSLSSYSLQCAFCRAGSLVIVEGALSLSCFKKWHYLPPSSLIALPHFFSLAHLAPTLPLPLTKCSSECVYICVCVWFSYRSKLDAFRVGTPHPNTHVHARTCSCTHPFSPFLCNSRLFFFEKRPHFRHH